MVTLLCHSSVPANIRGCTVLIINVAAKENPPAANLSVYMAIGFGIVLAGCVAVFLQLVRKNRNRAKKIFLSFIRS